MKKGRIIKMKLFYKINVENKAYEWQFGLFFDLNPCPYNMSLPSKLSYNQTIVFGLRMNNNCTQNIP